MLSLLGACSSGGTAPAGPGGASANTGGSGSGGTVPTSTGGTAGVTAGGGTGGMASSGSGGMASSGSGGMASSGSGGAPNTGSGGANSGGATGGVSPTGTGGTSASGGENGGSVGSGGGATGGSGTGTGGAAGSAGPPIVDLFNGTDLTGWTANRESAKMDQSVTPGVVLTPAQALVIFKVENGTIHVYGDAPDQSTQSRHTLVTTKSYSHYNLWLDYKWGTKKFAPYTNLTLYPRDAGILWNLHRDLTQVWPSSIEFQIKDGTVGDIFALLARCTSLALNNGTSFVDASAGGTSKLINGSTGNARHMRSTAFPNLEIPNDWNTVQLQANGGAAVYIVNGHVVNKVLTTTDTTGAPVTSGPIALQAEHAEVFYRNVRVQVLP